ncbi:MAG TPA: ATP-binding protein [Thermodesulfobacteriota bacterium]|nr:ATP-binding protein [Thermodesulfobacteriota bacterium]
MIRVLVAENDPAFLSMLEEAMKASQGDFSLAYVRNGRSCLEMLRKGSFNVLLLDYDLPDGSGLNWLRRFNEKGVGIPTIFVTEKGNPRLAIEAMREGIFDYINRSAECVKAFPFVLHRAVEGHTLMLEKVKIQKELIETRNFMESVVEKAGDAISVIDLDGRILYWNEGAERMYGCRKEEVRGKKLSECLYAENENLRAEEDRSLAAMMARIKKGEAIPPFETRRRLKDGREIVTQMALWPLKDAEGKITGAARTCRDITHLKRAEERLIQAERLSSLGELTAGVAHELRNPLAGIKINTQVLARKKDLSEKDRRILDSTQEGIDKIQKIVDDMLHFARPKAAHFEEEDIHAVIEKSLSVLQGKLKKGGIRCLFERHQGLPRIRFDIHQIQQVLINLLLNAIQAMENGGTLAIRTFQEAGKGVGVEIRDTGVGISPDHLKKIFDPFFTTKSEGTGLGLSITLKILENHGAALDVTSEEGKGSAFTIHFPRGDGRGV